MESAVEVSSNEVITINTAANAEFVEYALVLVKLTQFALNWLKHLHYTQWFIRHRNVPHLHCEEVSAEDKLSISAETGIRNTRNDFSEKVLSSLVLFFCKDLSCIVAYAAL